MDDDELERIPDPDFLNLPENYGEEVNDDQFYPLVKIPPKPVTTGEGIAHAVASVSQQRGYHKTRPSSKSDTTASLPLALSEHLVRDKQGGATNSQVQTITVCIGITKEGERCKNTPMEGHSYCSHHLPNKIVEPPKEPLNLPSCVNQYTFEEGKTAQKAIADGRTQKHWQQVENTLRMRHTMPGANHFTEFNPTASLLFFLEWSGVQLNVDKELLLQHLANMDFDAVILFGVCIALAVERGRFKVALDSLIDEIGWKPRSHKERLSMRYKIWRWLLMFDSMAIIGQRRKSYYDRQSKQYVPVAIFSPLLRITGVLAPMQTSINDVNPPFEVALVAGEWLEEHRENDKIVSYFGNLRVLANQSRGRPTARLAAHIGLSLNQKWREEASKTQVGTSGSDNRLTAHVSTFTRYELLSIFGGEVQQELEALMEGPHFKRAVDQWDEAIKLLKEWEVVGFAVAIPDPAQRKYDSHHFWYKVQKLDVRPGEAGTKAIKEIALTEKRRKRAASKKAASVKKISPISHS